MMREARLMSTCCMLVAALFTAPAAARVQVSFYSVKGSLLMTGRSVHAFIKLDGTLDADGRKIDENYGFSAKSSIPAFLVRPVEQTMLIERPDYIRRARFHFRVPISDPAYYRIVQEVQLWWHNPAYLWDIDKRNCVTFTGVVAQLAGLKADFPPQMMRKPPVYLDHLAALNPTVDRTAK
jgi:hypothetical protein